MINQTTKLKGIQYRDNKIIARIKIKGSEISKSFDKLEDATAWRKQMGEQKSSSDFLLCRELFPKWLENLKNDPSYSPQTCFRYAGDSKMHLFPFFGEFKIQEITDEHVLNFAIHLKDIKFKGNPLSPKTIKNVIGTLSTFFEYCWSRRYIQINPAATPLFRQNLKRIVKERRNAVKNIRVKARTHEEVNMLLSAAYRKDMQFGIITEFMLSTALRLGEAAALTWGDILNTIHPMTGENASFVIVNKTRDHRTRLVQNKAKWDSDGSVPISSSLLERLEKWKIHAGELGFQTQKHDVLFPYLASNPMRYSEMLVLLSERIGISRTTAHCLRHSSVTFLASCGHNLQQVQKFARHSSLDMTRAYFAASHMQINELTKTMDKFIQNSIPL